MHRPLVRRFVTLTPAVVMAAAVAFYAGLGLPACSTSGGADQSERELVGEPERPTGRGHRAGRDGDEPRREGGLWYRLALEGDQIRVALRLLAPPPRASFFVPSVDSDADPLANGLTFEGARGPKGPVSYERLPAEGRIDVESRKLDWVQLRYRISLDAFPDDAARPFPDRVSGTTLAYLPALLVVPSKSIVEPIRKIPVEIHAPSNWKVRATWTNRSRESSDDGNRRVHGYVARDIRTLRDAFFVAGPDLQVRASDSGETVVAAPTGDEAPLGRLLSTTTTIADAYRRQFGDPGRVLVFARPSGDASTPRVRGTAKRNGFVVHLPSERPLRPGVRILVAHEAFHLWNGHRAIPRPDSDRETRWFEEGGTHYVAIKTAWETDLVSKQAVRHQFAKSAFYYRRNPASSGGRATALDLDRLPYDRGVFLALALDDALHECSDGKRRFATWFQRLLESDPTYYDQETLESTFLTAAGDCKTASERWNILVERGRELKPADILAGVGLHYLEASTLDETRVLPIDGQSTVFESLFRSGRDDGGPSAHETSSNPPTPP